MSDGTSVFCMKNLSIWMNGKRGCTSFYLFQSLFVLVQSKLPQLHGGYIHFCFFGWEMSQFEYRGRK